MLQVVSEQELDSDCIFIFLQEDRMDRQTLKELAALYMINWAMV